LFNCTGSLFLRFRRSGELSEIEEVLGIALSFSHTALPPGFGVLTAAETILTATITDDTLAL